MYMCMFTVSRLNLNGDAVNKAMNMFKMPTLLTELTLPSQVIVDFFLVV